MDIVNRSFENCPFCKNKLKTNFKKLYYIFYCNSSLIDSPCKNNFKYETSLNNKIIYLYFEINKFRIYSYYDRGEKITIISPDDISIPLVDWDFSLTGKKVRRKIRTTT